MKHVIVISSVKMLTPFLLTLKNAIISLMIQNWVNIKALYAAKQRFDNGDKEYVKYCIERSFQSGIPLHSLWKQDADDKFTKTKKVNYTTFFWKQLCQPNLFHVF